MIKIQKLWIVLVSFVLIISCNSYNYETIENDPISSRIYTLENGLKVYMSVNKDEPRIEAHIAVRVGGKNDPHETTGLAHYFEHLMFKGTESFGTQNYEMEKPLLDQIEQKFEEYRKLTDESERTAMYKIIDSLSYEASKIAIPNEYDKLMAAIGASGTNAYTSYDMTVYTENIPSNQIENWAKIQSDRFAHSVIRGFHTELETVYEEKNMSLTQDFRKVYEAILSGLFQKHPYGTQTVLGTQQNLKNPSITNIKNYYKEWYVPNNMAICMSGDFNPDEAIKIIDKHFGQLKANPNLKEMNFEKEDEIKSPIVKEVYGLESPSVAIAWRLPDAKDSENVVMNLLSNILYNGRAGLIDLNINQKQKVLSAFGGVDEFADYSGILLMGEPKKGQTLEEVKNIMLEEINKVKKGEFDESLLKAIANNYKLEYQNMIDNNDGVVNIFVNSFVNGVPLKEVVELLDKVNTVTKEDIVAYANKYLGDSNYVVVNKIQGKDPNELKIEKPHITPIFTNRDTSSAFLRNIQSAVVKPIEPVFVDFDKDMSKLKGKSDIEILYKQNNTNDIFSLIYLFEMGDNNDNLLGMAAQYLDYLGTSNLTPEQVKQKFFSLACSFSVFPSRERTYITLSGLSENMKEAMSLLETLLADAQPNKQALNEMKNMTLQERENYKLNQAKNFSMLQLYAQYGAMNPGTNIVSKSELLKLKDETLIEKIKTLTSFNHRILYYGPFSEDEVVTAINDIHNVPEKLVSIEKSDKFKQVVTTENKVFLAPYDAKQIYFAGYSNRGEKYDSQYAPIDALYNEYFGGGMNSIVFQEMREARGLAYSARAILISPTDLDKNYNYFSFIATQNDKMMDAMDAFDQIINNIPLSENAFKIAKESLLANLRTQRTIKSNILWSYIAMEKLGLNYDINKTIYEKVQGYTLQDVVNFQQQWVKDRIYYYCILGDEKNLDLEGLKKYGKIEKLTTEQIFGY